MRFKIWETEFHVKKEFTSKLKRNRRFTMIAKSIKTGVMNARLLFKVSNVSKRPLEDKWAT